MPAARSRRFPPLIAGALGAVAMSVGTARAQLPAAAGGAPDPGLAFYGIQFYAHGEGGGARDPLVAEGGEGAAGVRYRRDFDKGGSAFIAAQVVFRNLRAGDNEYDYRAVVGLYTFEGQLISAAEKKLTVPPDWNYTWTSQSFGWPEPGKWDVGTYRVKVWLEGSKVGEAAFYVRDEKVALEPGVGELEIESLGFYEGGDFFTPDIAKRASTRFPRAAARRIYWVVRARNRLHRARAHRPNLIGYFYRPDGTLFAAAPNSAVVAPEVAEATLVEGVGWPDAGKWEPGEYRFELELDHRVIAERRFTITDPFTEPRTVPAVVHFGLLDSGVYPGEAAVEPGSAESRAAYDAEFDPGSGPLWAEFVVVNNPHHRAAHTHRVSWRLLSPEGAVLDESESDFTIQPAWKTASQRVPLRPPGGTGEAEWPPGAYKVELAIGGRLLKVLRFRVVGPAPGERRPGR